MDSKRWVILKVDPTDPARGSLVSGDTTFYKVKGAAENRAKWLEESKGERYVVKEADEVGLKPKPGELNIGG